MKIIEKWDIMEIIIFSREEHNMNNINDDTQLLKRNPEEMSLTEYRAAFYQLIAKPDSITKVFNRAAVIDIQDIYELNERICTKLGRYKEAGFIIQVRVKFSDGKTKTFPDWKSFSSHSWFEPESINNIILIWEFNAVFPDLKIPERHTLMVKLSNGLRPEEMLNLVFTGKIEEIAEMDNNLFPIVARVDFVDRVLGDELLDIVGKWVKSLQESTVQKSKFMLFLKKNKGKVSSLFNWLTNIVVMWCSVWCVGKWILSLGFDNLSVITKEQTVGIIYAVFICAAIWTFSKRIIGTITDFLFEKLREYGESALFNITKGDRNKQERIRREEKASRIVIVGNILVTTTINILCGIIVNLIAF